MQTGLETFQLDRNTGRGIGQVGGVITGISHEGSHTIAEQPETGLAVSPCRTGVLVPLCPERICFASSCYGNGQPVFECLGFAGPLIDGPSDVVWFIHLSILTVRHVKVDILCNCVQGCRCQNQEGAPMSFVHL